MRNYELKNLSLKVKVMLFILPLIATLIPIGIFLYEPPAPPITVERLTKVCGGSLVSSSMSYTIKSKFVPCYLDYFKSYTNSNGIDKGIEQFNLFSSKSNGLQGECHAVGHALGVWAYKEFGEKAFNNNYASCAFAYGHGLLQAASAELTPDLIVKNLAPICYKEENLSDCVHGFGHSLGQSKLTVINTDQVCQKLNISLASYAQAHNYPKDVLYSLCMEGWVMEKYTANPFAWQELTTVNQALEWCAGITGVGHAGCAGIAIRNYIVASKTKNYDSTPETYKRLEEFVSYCSKTQFEIHVICVQHLGMTMGEVYDLTDNNIDVASKLSTYCTGTNSYECTASFLNSRLSKLGGNIEKIKTLCNFLKDEPLANCQRFLQSDKS